MSAEENFADAHKGEVVASIAYVNGRRDREVPIDEVGQHTSPTEPWNAAPMCA